MAKKKFRFPITIGIVDEAKRIPEKLDSTGRVVQHESVSLLHIPPGTEVEVEEAEAARIYAVHGTYEEFVARQALEDQLTAARKTIAKATEMPR